MTAEHCRNASTNKSFSHYLSLCDENTRKDIRKLVKLEMKIVDLKYSVLFNSTCKKEALLPKYIHIQINHRVFRDTLLSMCS